MTMPWVSVPTCQWHNFHCFFKCFFLFYYWKFHIFLFDAFFYIQTHFSVVLSFTTCCFFCSCWTNKFASKPFNNKSCQRTYNSSRISLAAIQLNDTHTHTPQVRSYQGSHNDKNQSWQLSIAMSRDILLPFSALVFINVLKILKNFTFSVENAFHGMLFTHYFVTTTFADTE